METNQTSPTDKRKAKVTKVLKMDKKDNYGNTSFIIEFDNGDKGFYTSKNENQTKFVPTQESDYLIEAKLGKNGTYHKITLPQVEGGKPGFSGGGGFKQDPKVSMIGFAMSYTKDLIVAGKVELKDLGMQFEVIYNEMISKL